MFVRIPWFFLFFLPRLTWVRKIKFLFPRISIPIVNLVLPETCQFLGFSMSIKFLDALLKQDVCYYLVICSVSLDTYSSSIVMGSYSVVAIFFTFSFHSYIRIEVSLDDGNLMWFVHNFDAIQYTVNFIIFFLRVLCCRCAYYYNEHIERLPFQLN